MAKRGKQKQKGKPLAAEVVIEAAPAAPVEALDAVEVESLAPAETFVEVADAFEAVEACLLYTSDAGRRAI